MAEFNDGARTRLAADLQKAIAGSVGFDNGSRALYATDSSNYRQVPIGVVQPRTVEDVIATVALCRKYDAPLLPRGGGTSLAGQCCNTAVVIDMSRHLDAVKSIDSARKTAIVEPGCVLDDLREAAERHHLTFGPDPSTHDHNTLGGMIGNNSCGVHSVMSGRTADNVNRLEILTYDGLRMWVGPTPDSELEQIIAAGGRRGEIYGRLKSLRDRYAEFIRARFPKIPRRVSGYNLDDLLPEKGFNVARALVGSEGTCALVLAAELRLVHSPPGRALAVLGYPDVFSAGDHVPDILRYKPLGLEGLDDRLIRYMRKKPLHAEDLGLLPEGNGWLLVELGGESREEAAEKVKALCEDLGRRPDAPHMKSYTNMADEARLWEIRKSGLGATAWVPGQPPTWPGWEDAAVSPEKVGRYLRDFRKLLGRYGYDCAIYGHFGDGCIHVRIDFELTSQAGIDKYRRFLDDAADLVVQYGGSLSGEHGDGQARGPLLSKMFGPELIQAFQEFKDIWDPAGKMNPGKMPQPAAPDAHLRLGAGFHRDKQSTVFQFPADGGDFSHATLRCVGVGECRRHGGGVMCPSYMATREEQHSTRGRARLLFEMLQGDPLNGGWRSEAVRNALDLCLACKGCRHDCPVNVDMATYKAEFFSHYYGGRLRPRAAWSMGLIHWWCRAAGVAPGLANFIGQTPGVSQIAKWAGDLAPQRRVPRFSREPFREQFRRRGYRRSGGNRVLLWPDTFNNYFHAETAMSATEALGRAGFEVVLPERVLCCARPLYAWGMLDLARRQLSQILATLGPEVEAGTPLVGLEPACMSVFRDEMLNLFPENKTARKLAENSFLLGDFLTRNDYRPPRLRRRAVVHTHCHHRSVLGLAGQRKMLDALGLDYRILDSGCCGMAGSFGFERDHYEVAMKIGERTLLPAVRALDDDVLVIANGFSCREQIEQGSVRRTLHLAEVLRMAQRQSAS
ncbi:MAG TPA: FAD-binding and (Fe-S)-binding domain-containing protein [Ferrovibrio sp.]|uniref:FAD-binding and (Fe-S)-binding domain-containing protein n=1 Tax=Ferrovibrio sp. TaxID=1917215 RepID=UPI002ED12FF7